MPGHPVNQDFRVAGHRWGCPKNTASTGHWPSATNRDNPSPWVMMRSMLNMTIQQEEKSLIWGRKLRCNPQRTGGCSNWVQPQKVIDAWVALNHDFKATWKSEIVFMSSASIMFLHRKNAIYFYDRHQKVFETLYSRRYCNDHQGIRSEKFPYPDRSIHRTFFRMYNKCQIWRIIEEVFWSESVISKVVV